MYADDTTIYCIGRSVDEVAAALNQSLTELYAWCVRNKLTPHPKKSEYMLIHRGSFTGPHPYTLETTFWNGSHKVDSWVSILTIN